MREHLRSTVSCDTENPKKEGDDAMTETRKSPVSFILKDTLLPWRGMLLSSGAELLDYPAGSVLSRSGEVNQHIYFLLRGIVKTYTSNVSGYLRLLGYHKANTIFTLDNLRGGEPAVVSNEALTSIIVLRFTPELLQRICRQNPAFATDMALYVGDVLRLMCFDAEKQSIDDVQTRLATFMCLYIESSAETCAEKNVVPMTQESLASAINASRIQTSRICAQLKADGIISIGRKRVEVLDLPALMAMRQ